MGLPYRHSGPDLQGLVLRCFCQLRYSIFLGGFPLVGLLKETKELSDLLQFLLRSVAPSTILKQARPNAFITWSSHHGHFTVSEPSLILFCLLGICTMLSVMFVLRAWMTQKADIHLTCPHIPVQL